MKYLLLTQSFPFVDFILYLTVAVFFSLSSTFVLISFFFSFFFCYIIIDSISHLRNTREFIAIYSFIPQRLEFNYNTNNTNDSIHCVYLCHFLIRRYSASLSLSLSTSLRNHDSIYFLCGKKFHVIDDLELRHIM